MMKWVWIALVMALSVQGEKVGLDHDDLRSLMLGCLDGLQITEDRTTLLRCLDDSVLTPWNEFLSQLKLIKDWTNKVQLLYAFALFTVPSITSLGLLMPCSDEEIAKIYVKIKAVMDIPGELTKRVVTNADAVAQSFQGFLMQATNNNYVDAGYIAGTLMNFIMIN